MWLSPGRAQVGAHVNVPKAPMPVRGQTRAFPLGAAGDGPPWGEPIAGAFLYNTVQGKQLAGICYNCSVINAIYGNKLSNNGISPEGDFFSSLSLSELVSEMVFALFGFGFLIFP